MPDYRSNLNLPDLKNTCAVKMKWYIKWLILHNFEQSNVHLPPWRVPINDKQKFVKVSYKANDVLEFAII